MDVFEAIKKRREITKYEERPIPNDVLERVVDAGYFAPTGNNLPSKNLIVIKNRETLDRLAETTPYMKWLKEAQAAIAVTANPEVSKYWLQDASIACAFIWLQCVEEGLGSAFGAVFNNEDEEESIQRESYAREILEIPDENRVIAVLGIGYPKEHPAPKKHIDREKIVRYEKF
ncbi:MAG: nitroreductase [Bacilli bacterium]|nr:nitroreductase [Bacilli bacterium]